MKDQSRIVPKFDKKNIDVTMEPWQDMDLLLYGLECRQCPHGCELRFIDRKGFSFASAAKLGAFALSQGRGAGRPKVRRKARWTDKSHVSCKR